MSTTGAARMITEGGDPVEQRVTPLELFFDLVFVFALTQVTGFLVRSPHVAGDVAGRRAAHGAVVVVGELLVAYQRRAGRGGDPSAAGDLLRDGCHVRSLACRPRRLRRVRGDLRGGLLRGVALAGDPVRARHRTRAGTAPGHPPARTGLLGRPCAAHRGRLPRRLRPGCSLGCCARSRYGVAYVRGVSGFRIHPGHFAERHGLVVIIALGESIVAVGVGASGVGLGAGVLVAAVLGIALAAALWWAYFDLVMLTAERRLSAAQGEERARLARDSYSYLHLPMVAGIIFAALGIEQTLAHVGEPLGTIPAVALCGGVALYLLGHNAFRLREEGSVSVPRLVVAVVCLALIPVAVSVPSLITLAVLTVLLCGLAAFETATSREFRRELRAR